MYSHWYNIHSYHHVDFGDHFFLRPIEELIPDQIVRKQFVEKLEQMFEFAGWEGDGEVQYFLTPVFFDPHGVCRHGFHVKQCNNGTSFVALENGPSPDFNDQAEFITRAVFPWTQKWPLRYQYGLTDQI
ncbi:MAG: hypothetical protein JNL74_01340 [Fibrobacteres bacterium]|nr:hypothetical protein [Fibrobacterota bacterium]